MIFRLDLKKALTLSFVALGPLGNILTPHFFPESFRAYYFLLPFFPLFFFSANRRIAKIAIFFLPFLIYCYISALIVERFDLSSESHTLFRFFLLICQFFFVVGAASAIKKQEEILPILKIYLTFFFFSMAIGYVFFFGYYLNLVPIEWIVRFSVLTQFGFGLLRFSPGSYPNEYGIVSSFVLAVLMLMALEKRCAEFKFSKSTFAFLFLATFLAFLLTTTRAAYLSFFASILCISWQSGNFIKAFSTVILFIVAFFALLLIAKINMFHILTTGFSQSMNEGSLGERISMWLQTVEKAEDHSFWGAGFASLTNIHNVYLQLFFELGFVGLILLTGSLLLIYIEVFLKHKKPASNEMSLFLSKIRMIGLINVLSFAASNHNLNHHLTWFVCFLCFAALRVPYLSENRLKMPTQMNS